jgi:hypothetical protein
MLLFEMVSLAEGAQSLFKPGTLQSSYLSLPSAKIKDVYHCALPSREILTEGSQSYGPCLILRAQLPYYSLHIVFNFFYQGFNVCTFSQSCRPIKEVNLRKLFYYWPAFFYCFKFSV